MISGEFLTLINILAWPLVVSTALFLLRQPLKKFISDLGGRATKFSIFQFALELAPELKPSWSAGNIDFRKLTEASVFDSYAQTLFQQIGDTTAADYAIIDLGKEKNWLTSRLYIFALMLERMRDLKCLVFLETRGDTDKQFLGTASPERVRWVLARQYPWLESAFSQAYAQISPQPPYININTEFIMSDHGALNTQPAIDLSRQFIESIQKATPDTNVEEWVLIPSSMPLWEHAVWLDNEERRRILNPLLQTSSFLDSVDMPSEKRSRAILRREGEFVALVDEHGRFKGLIDRQAMTEQVAKKYAEPTEDE